MHLYKSSSKTKTENQKKKKSETILTFLGHCLGDIYFLKLSRGRRRRVVVVVVVVGVAA
jgi:hypothetical protein